MTPDKPATPDEGKPDAAKVEEQAKEAKGEKKPAKPRKAPAKKADKPAEAAAESKTAADKKAEAAKKPAAAKKPPAKKKGDAEAAKTPTAKRTKEKLADEADETAAKTTGTDKKGAEAAKKPATASSRRRDQKKPAGERVVVRAQARYVRSSARKARLVCDHIRGKDVAQARAILAYSPRNVAEAWSKLLESAVANAENNHDLNGDDLQITAVYADEGPTIKRFRPRAMGRATRIRKRTSHLSIALTPKEN